jgi:hypothetical protein
MRFLAIFLLLPFFCNAQLIFKNSNSDANTITKFIVKESKTELYGLVNGKETLLATSNKVPVSFSSEDGQNQYKLTVTNVDKVAIRSYEIQYSLYRQTNKRVGYIKSTFEYFDKRSKTIIEDYFTI